MTTLRPSASADVPHLHSLWRRSVRATHHFLAEADFREIDRVVGSLYLPNAQLVVAVDDSDHPLGFMGMNGSHIDSLFIDPDHRGAGLGRMLVEHAARLCGVVTVDVNEQNDQAVGFYRKLGFTETGRSPTDDDGRPYPLLHMVRTQELVPSR